MMAQAQALTPALPTPPRRVVADTVGAPEPPASASEALESLPVGLLTVDRRGVVRSANAQGRRLLGVRRRGAVLERRLLDRLSGPDRERLLEALARVGTATELTFDDVALTAADGAARIVRVQARRAARGNAVLLVLVDVTQTHARAQRAEHEARHDALTGLANRAHAMQALDEMIERARRSGQGVAATFIDLDRFKAVNDTWGHEAGDALLLEVAARLRASVGLRGLPARLGGDEFLVLWPDLPTGVDASEWARGVMDAIAQPLRLRGQDWTPGASAGLSLFPRDAQDARALLRQADRALYRAKRDGRNRLCLCGSADADAGADAELGDAKLLQQSLATALQRDELHLRFEPQFDLVASRPCGLGAVLCWDHPARGLLVADHFLVPELDVEMQRRLADQALDQAQQHLLRWTRSGATPLRLSLPVLPAQLASSDLADRVRTLLATTALPASALQLQIPGTSLPQASAQAMETLGALREAGVGLAVDRVGAGLLALHALSRLRPAALRVDPEVIGRLPDAHDSRALLRAIVGLSHAMSMRVLADGVRTSDQLACLRALGVDEVQGPHLGQPMTADVVPTWWRAPPGPQGLLSAASGGQAGLGQIAAPS
jgi:diguanylate cyclase (GGDEF)-like protein